MLTDARRRGVILDRTVALLIIGVLALVLWIGRVQQMDRIEEAEERCGLPPNTTPEDYRTCVFFQSD